MKIYKYKNLEYTGENRCGPYTVLNTIIAAFLSLIVAQKSRVSGYAAFAVSVGLIYIRGYLVPGTPTLTKQYLPERVLYQFGKKPELQTKTGLWSATDAPSDDAVSDSQELGDSKLDLDDYLLTEEVLKPCENQQDLCLTRRFKQAWNSEISELSDVKLKPREAASGLGFETNAEKFDINHYGNACELVVDSRTVGQWPSRSALLADISAAHVLSEWSVRWDTLKSEQRGQILHGLRLFLEECPGKVGTVSMNQEMVESCCS